MHARAQLIAGLSALLAAGCLVDSDAPCGPTHIQGPAGTCLALDDGAGADAGLIADSGAATALPTGLGATCSAQADCAQYEATYCEMLQAHVCLIQDCTPSPESCPAGWSCCDLTPFGLPRLCVTAGSCPS